MMSFPVPERPLFEIAPEPDGWWLELADVHGGLIWGGPFSERGDADRFLRWLLAAASLKTKLIASDWTSWPQTPRETVSFEHPEAARLEASKFQGGHRLAVMYDGQRLLVSCELRSRIDVHGLYAWLGSDGASVDVEYPIREPVETDVAETEAASWFAQLEQRIKAERRGSSDVDVVELVHDAEWERLFETPDPGPTTSNGVTIGAGENARVLCPACGTEFETTGPELPTVGVRCRWCQELVMPVELVLTAGGVWMIDRYDGCNARSFRLSSGGFAAFCRCGRGWHGPRRPEDAEATLDAEKHRARETRDESAGATSDVGA